MAVKILLQMIINNYHIISSLESISLLKINSIIKANKKTNKVPQPIRHNMGS